MDITSPVFVAFALGVALLSNLHPSPRYRAWVLAAASLFFIGSYLTSPLQALPLAAFLLLGYGMVQLQLRRPGGRSLASSIVSFLVVYVLLKKFSFLGDFVLPFPYLLIGLSYILFRVLHLMVDARSGELPAAPGLLEYFNYTSNFLSFVSGPIQRYQDFHEQMRAARPALTADEAFAAFARVTTGFIKVSVLSATANYLFLDLSGRLLRMHDQGSLPQAILLYSANAVAYVYYLYFNFSGYMDIVIGAGCLLGLKLPENFDRPFVSRSFLEFWTRWHMTLSDWFKVYLFTPLMRVLVERFPSAGTLPYLGVIGFFVTFLVMGVWHGTTFVFVFYGLFVGAGASLNKLWQVVLGKRLGKKRYRALCERPLYQYLCRGLTFTWFTMAVTAVWINLSQLGLLAKLMGAGGALAAFVLMTLGAAVATFAWDRIAAMLGPAGNALTTLAKRPAARQLALAARMILIVVVASFFHKAPDFIYKAF